MTEIDPLPPSRRRMFATASLASLMVAALAVPAAAQVQPAPANPAPAEPVQALPGAPENGPATIAPEAPPQSEDAGPAPDIVVTGSRIVSSGFAAPTPTTVIGAEQLALNAQPNIFNTIAQLPSLQGSTGVTTGTNSTSSGSQGLSSFSLRGLGTIRTLTLLDGQRVVGANVTGVPDISQFPQLLIERVDVVTGGASASYGSDAVGGVVNFVTNKRFKGVKGNVQGGISDYGDDESVLAQLAFGTSFLGDRLHLIVSGEYAREEGVGPGGYGEEGPAGRDWYTTATLVNRGITNDGAPQFNYREHAQAYQYTRYGLINAGPLQGIAFDANGQPFNFNYGSNGVPRRNTNGDVAGCYVGFCIGGDLSGNVGIGTTLKSRLERYNGYGRLGFDLDADNEIYATVNISQVDTSNQPNPGAAQTSLTINCANAFLPSAITGLCAANNITSFRYGVTNAILPNIEVFPSRKQYRFVGGATGKVSGFGTDWRYDAYYEHGENITDITVNNMLVPRRYLQAIDAVNVNGVIVCRDPTARANGCQPLNIFGGATPSSAALSYLQPANGPFQHTRQTQDVFSANLSGDPLSTWAGPVSIATGLEYRHEFYHVTSDPYGNGPLPGTPYNDLYPFDPVLNPEGNNWYAGNYHSGRGSYNVLESYLELNVPLLNTPTLGRANLNVAGRATNYSTSGTVYAWKVGGTYDTPIDGLRLRAVTSRDVRAPNLSELFAAPIAVTVPNFTDPFNNTSVTITQNTIGNPNLRPETARNTELGVVYAQPSWLPGLSLSFDYYKIKVRGLIQAVSAQQKVNFCQQGVTELCGGFFLQGANNQGNFVDVQPFNLASIRTEGFDIEASYQIRQPLGLPGRFTVRGLATHVINFVTDLGLPGAVPVDSAGANSGNTPSWKWLTTETYTQDEFSIFFQQRWFSDGVFGNQYVVCQSSCPVSTANAPTIDFNRMKGAFYFDVGGSYTLTKALNAYFKVDNLFNRDPTPSPQTNTGVDINPALYDIIGRVYRVGVRFNF
ncbi:TonB-dependent Receptor Plug Domain [Sphingomonas carotinifaciens]|uniref:TonB-dependent Receptor Plug Domain n=2 Tax=Sphingomonas carotinifaciens TaxID=1166323 RepID=A0A1G7MD42_9SPHN|nr:outer membrane receptor protein involved in Fe transport [Sphingomonas carotinifaciens]SDF59717.1 TonB-dependent Receptor Plug Domain [Sphingomonas carotinifaciens]